MDTAQQTDLLRLSLSLSLHTVARRSRTNYRQFDTDERDARIFRQFGAHYDGISGMEPLFRDALHGHRQYPSFRAQAKLVEALEGLRFHGIREGDLPVEGILDYVRK